MNRWYRAYEGTVTDPKLARAALRAGVSRSVVIAAWHCLLEDAAGCQAGGAFRIDAEGIAAVLIEQPEVIDKVMKAFADVALIVDGIIDKWSKRQYESDSSTERSRKFREKQKTKTAPPPAPPKKQAADDATLQGRSATPPETDTETDTDTELKKQQLSLEVLGTPPAAASNRGTRLPKDWLLPSSFGNWAIAEFPHLSADFIRQEGLKFRDYWVPKTGKDATKIEWEGTWRNWVRKANAEWQRANRRSPGTTRAGDVQGTEDHNVSVVEEVRRARAQQHSGVTA